VASAFLSLAPDPIEAPLGQRQGMPPNHEHKLPWQEELNDEICRMTASREIISRSQLLALTGGADHPQACRLLKVDRQCFRRGRSSRAGPDVEFPGSMNVHHSELVGGAPFTTPHGSGTEVPR
jgi:hypothetical protein